MTGYPWWLTIPRRHNTSPITAATSSNTPYAKYRGMSRKYAAIEKPDQLVHQLVLGTECFVDDREG